MRDLIVINDKAEPVILAQHSYSFVHGLMHKLDFPFARHGTRAVDNECNVDGHAARLGQRNG
jgi:hypothetical protein